MDLKAMPTSATAERSSKEGLWLSAAAFAIKQFPILNNISLKQSSLHRVEPQFLQPLRIGQILHAVYILCPHPLSSLLPPRPYREGESPGKFTKSWRQLWRQLPVSLHVSIQTHDWESFSELNSMSYITPISIHYVRIGRLIQALQLNPAFAGGGGGVKRPHFFRRVITPVWRGAAAPNFG